MKPSRVLTLGAAVLNLAACDNGDVNTQADYNPPPLPAIQHPTYNPYAAYGDAHATWQPPVVDRAGTILKPEEPATEWARPGYEAAPWATGAKPSPYGGPPGTF